LSSAEEEHPPARSTVQRRADIIAKLDRDVDIWVASADSTGRTHLIPLSFYWDGARLTVATPSKSVTGRNLTRAGWARMALGPTRDVVVLEGPIEILPIEGADDLASAHAAKAGFDAREAQGSWIFARMTPERIQAWREVNELEGRDVMLDGKWLA
jgi:Pyridoxamine 5'-phosphate oxidase